MSITLPTTEQVVEAIKQGMRIANLSQDMLAEKTGLSQATIHRIVSAETIPHYDEAKRILDAISGKISSIPIDKTAHSMAVKTKVIVFAYLDESLKSACSKMMDHGFSQLPVTDGRGNFEGMLTEMSILRLYLTPRLRINLEEAKVGDIKEYFEDIPKFPHSEKLSSLAPVLQNYYAVLVERKEPDEEREPQWDYYGMITRADILRLVTG